MNEIITQSNTDREGLDVQISTAKAYPRDTKRCVQEAIDMATMDEETAESCIYALPRGIDKGGEKNYIKGESVRLAEILMSAWGNMHAATRIIGNDGKTITAEAAAWDLEKNVKIRIENQRRITGKDGRTFNQDMVVVTGNAAASIALRNAILRVIPKAFAKRVYDAAVNFAVGDQKKLSTKVTEVFAKFKNNWGIENEKILNYFDKKELSEITREDLEEIIGIGTAIKSKDISIDKAFVKVGDVDSSKSASLEAMLLQTKETIEQAPIKKTDKVAEEKPQENMNKIFERNIKGDAE